MEFIANVTAMSSFIFSWTRPQSYNCVLYVVDDVAIENNDNEKSNDDYDDDDCEVYRDQYHYNDDDEIVKVILLAV
ncbi:Hypothetical predicted protein [Octopus vulgaris]|uniref:Uncharacterized protein n=1 Tax=Octopus vulgaris TaxID=6645 RepID=A0AA36AXZ1_OCTVU|nr:Hypothetical predicted protein [Octopus vulgaris]